MTTGTVNGMDPRSWAFLACRVLALYFLYLAISTLLAFAFWAFAPSARETGQHVEYYYGLLFLVQCAAALGLWIGAHRLAPRMVPKPAEGAQAAVPGEWNVTQLLSLAVSVLGLVLLFFAFPQAARLVARYLMDDHVQYSDPSEIAFVATRLVVGILLVFGSRGIANIVGRARRWQ